MAPHLNHPPELLLKAQGIGVVFFDVDGVLTDGGLYFSSTGESLKRFNTLDGHGLKLLQGAGIVPVVITGRDSRSLRLRLQNLGVEHAHYAVKDKFLMGQTVLRAMGKDWSQAAAMGDDWPDLGLMRRCGFSAAPANAHGEITAIADYVCAKSGGNGAVREVCDLLLVAGGTYARLLGDAAA